MGSFTESTVEQAALAWLESVGWSVRHGAEIAPGELAAERSDYGQVVLAQRLRDALARLNRGLPAEALDDAFRKLTRPEGADAVSAQPRGASPARGRRDGRVPHARRRDPRRPGAGARLRRTRRQRLAGGQPVHRGREQAQPPAGRRALRQRPAAGGRRAEERGGRERHDLDGLPAAPDLQGRDPGALRHERAAGRLRRRGGARRHAHRRARVVQALAHHRGRAPAPIRICRSCRW